MGVGEDDVAALDGSSLTGDRAIWYRVERFGDSDGDRGELVELANGSDVVLEVVREREEGAVSRREVSSVSSQRTTGLTKPPAREFLRQHE